MPNIPESSILLSTGDYFSFDGPYVFDASAISAALAKLCRFTGHVSDFYSVAQHSVHVSRIVPPEFAFEGLMHDAVESVLGDVSTILKRRLPDYKALEHTMEKAMRAQFGLPDVMSPVVKQADLIMLATERRDLMPLTLESWAILRGVPALEEHIDPWGWSRARREFDRRFAELAS